MTVEITTTRDIARQILRHRSFSFQEFSQRYAAVVAPPVLREARMQDAKNRQASNDTDDTALQEWWADSQRAVAGAAATIYTAALKRGIAKEVARSVLPEGNTESVLYMAGTIRSWIHYCQLRTAPGTQKEHRDVALEAEAILMAHFPALADVLGGEGAE
jgi:thymidylate synthase (FAD)